MLALAELTLGEHEVCCGGGETSGDVSSNSGENQGLCHVIPGTKHRVEHMATQTHMMCRSLSRSHIHRARQAYTYQSCVSEWLGLQLLCQQYLGTLRECSQLCFRAGEGESGSRPPDDCFCRIS